MSEHTGKKQIGYSAAELRLKDLPMFALILSAVIVLMLIAGLRLRADISGGAGAVTELKKGWYFLDGSKRVDVELPASIAADGRTELVLYNDRLSEFDTGSVVCTKAGIYKIDIMRHGYLLYRYDDELFPKNAQTASRMYCTAVINNEYGDSPLAIVYHLPDESSGREAFDIPPVYAGDPKAMFLFNMGEHTVSIIFTAAMLAAGCAALAFGLYFGKFAESRRLTDLAVFMFIFTVWCITDSGLLMHINDNGKKAAIGYLSFYTFMSFLIPVLLYAKHTENGGSLFYDRLIALLAGNIIVQTFLNMVCGIPFADMLPATHILLIAEGLLVFGRMYRIGTRVHNSAAVKFVLGEAFMIITGLLSLEIYWVSGVYRPAVFEAGVLLYALYTIYDIYICVYNQETMRRKMLMDGSRHIDPVTGMPDEYVYEQDLNWIKEEHESFAEVHKKGFMHFIGLSDSTEGESRPVLDYVKLDIHVGGLQDNADDDTAPRLRRLAAAAMLMRNVLGSEGACYCLGGDRLCVLMPGDVHKAKQAAENIAAAAVKYNKEADSCDRIVLSCRTEEVAGENKNI